MTSFENSNVVLAVSAALVLTSKTEVRTIMILQTTFQSLIEVQENWFSRQERLTD